MCKIYGRMKRTLLEEENKTLNPKRPKFVADNDSGTLSKFWCSSHTWKRSANNTKWCLIGCAIGDFGTVLFFQLCGIDWPPSWIFSLAIINGLLTSICLETVILVRRDFTLSTAFKTAMGMSFISMLAMETAMNVTDFLITGGAHLTTISVPIMLLVGFVTPWPYNYWRLKKFGKACH